MTNIDDENAHVGREGTDRWGAMRTDDDAATDEAGVGDTNSSGSHPGVGSPEDSSPGSTLDGEHAAASEQAKPSSFRDVVEWVAVVVVALVAALVIREYLVQAFEIPSRSMEQTVNVDDRILVNKLSYDFGEIQRGDLVVFERGTLTEGNTEELIKRAIALPGETIEVRPDGEVYIWGFGEGPEDALLLNEAYLDDASKFTGSIAETSPIINLWHERCLNPSTEPNRCTLDRNSYFMMGDNRFNSTDSRSFGPVPEENVVGRAFFRIWPLSEIGSL